MCEDLHRKNELSPSPQRGTDDGVEAGSPARDANFYPTHLLDAEPREVSEAPEELRVEFHRQHGAGRADQNLGSAVGPEKIITYFRVSAGCSFSGLWAGHL